MIRMSKGVGSGCRRYSRTTFFVPLRMTRSVQCFPDVEALSSAIADEITAIAAEDVRDRGRSSIALSGGKTPERLFHLLAGRGPDALPWSQVDIWWCDERAVPPSHPDSNYRRAREALIEPLGLAAGRVHPLARELADPEAARPLPPRPRPRRPHRVALSR